MTTEDSNTTADVKDSQEMLVHEDLTSLLKVMRDVRAQLYTLIDLAETNKHQNRELIEKIAKLT